jgi:hypothetical protein
MPFFLLLGISAKKEVEKLNPEEFFLKQTRALQDSASEMERDFFCNYEKNFPKTATG